MRSLADIKPGVTISSLPFSITQPGVYTLSGNLSGVSGQNGITVMANNVTIDLSGFALSGGAGSLDGIFVEGAFGNTTVRNGVVRNWGDDGVVCSSSSGILVENVLVTGCGGDGIEVSSGVLSGIECRSNAGVGVRCSGNPLDGIDVQIRESPTRSSALRSNGLGGLHISGACSVRCDEVDIEGNTGHGVHVESSSGVPSHGSLYQTGGRCSSNTGDGIHGDIDDDGLLDVVVSRVVCDNNGGDGIEFVCTSPNATVDLDLSDGSSSSNGGAGLVSSGTAKQKTWLCSNFKIQRNASSGIVTSPGTSPALFTLDACDISFNTGSGIDDGGSDSAGSHWQMSACTVSNNTLHGMSTRLRGIDKKDIKRGCVFRSNGGSGLHIESSLAGSRLDLDCDDADFSSNGASGIRKLTPHPNVVTVLGLSACSLNDNTLDALDMDDDGDGIETRVSLVDSSVCDNGGKGISATGKGNSSSITVRVDRIELMRNAGGGVDQDCDGDNRDDDCDLTDLRCVSNGGDGVRVHRVGTGGSLAVSLDACRVDSNVGCGIVIREECDDKNFFVRCVDTSSSSNTLDGTLISVSGSGSGVRCDTTHLRCVSSNNGGHGLHLEGSVDLIVPVAMDKGLRFGSSSSRYSSNGLDGIRVTCAVPTGTASYGVSLDDCDVSGNDSSGLRVLGSGGGGGGGCALHLASTRCSGNGDDGVHVDASLMTNFAVLLDGRDNDCDDSDDDGIYLRGSSVGKPMYEWIRSSLSRNGGDGLDADCDDLDIEACDITDNGAFGITATCAGSFSSSACRVSDNGQDGAHVSAATIRSTENDYSGNGGTGLHATASRGGVIHRDLAARNVLLGISVAGDNFEISDNRCIGHRDLTGTTNSAGIRVAGSGNQIHGNFLADNDYGVHMVSGSNPVYQNSGHANTNPLFEEAAATADVGPPGTAATATSPMTNIGF